MNSPYPRPPSPEGDRASKRFNRMDGLMLTLLLVVMGFFVLLVFFARLKS